VSEQVSGRIVTPDGVVDGVLTVDGERIAGIAPGTTDTDWIVPGFVDIHTSRTARRRCWPAWSARRSR
jgi:alpha-D-ribose 1-methylphosphonate 5-triphosphate diphosphatase PhnM